MPEDILDPAAAPAAPETPAAPDAAPASPNVDPNPGGPTGAGEEDIDAVMERNFSELMGEKPTGKPAEKAPEKPPVQAKAKAPAAAPAKQPAKPPEQKQDKPPEKQPEKQPEKPAAAAPESKVKRPWEIVREKEKAIADLETRYKALEQEHARYKTMGEPGAPNPEVEQLRKQVEEQDQKIQYLEYSQSDKFAITGNAQQGTVIVRWQIDQCIELDHVGRSHHIPDGLIGADKAQITGGIRDVIQRAAKEHREAGRHGRSCPSENARHE